MAKKLLMKRLIYEVETELISDDEDWRENNREAVEVLEAEAKKRQEEARSRRRAEEAEHERLAKEGEEAANRRLVEEAEAAKMKMLEEAEAAKIKMLEDEGVPLDLSKNNDDITYDQIKSNLSNEQEVAINLSNIKIVTEEWKYGRSNSPDAPLVIDIEGDIVVEEVEHSEELETCDESINEEGTEKEEDISEGDEEIIVDDMIEEHDDTSKEEEAIVDQAEEITEEELESTVEEEYGETVNRLRDIKMEIKEEQGAFGLPGFEVLMSEWEENTANTIDKETAVETTVKVEPVDEEEKFLKTTFKIEILANLKQEPEDEEHKEKEQDKYVVPRIKAVGTSQELFIKHKEDNMGKRKREMDADGAFQAQSSKSKETSVEATHKEEKVKKFIKDTEVIPEAQSSNHKETSDKSTPDDDHKRQHEDIPVKRAGKNTNKYLRKRSLVPIPAKSSFIKLRWQ